ncbi:MAG: ATP-binding cassette domain-containing protein [Candidatus Baltobacteraceae bacterium]
MSQLSVRPFDVREAPAGDREPLSSLLRLTEVSKRFGEFVALDSVSLSVQRGEILGIIGRSGAGKTTLIRCLNGLEHPDTGAVEIDGVDITGLSERELQPIRRRIGMIFQQFNLLSQKTVAQNIALPLRIAGRSGDAKRRVAELLDLVGLTGKAGAYPAQLSGGQKQRVGIARALAAEPVLLLSDEATSALDPESTLSILALLREINERLGLTIVLITHEMSVIRAIADRVVVLEDARVIETGPVSRVFAEPEAAGTRSLLGSLRPELPAAFAARLRAEPGETIVLRLDVQGDEARAPLLAELSQAFGAATLLHGGIDDVQGQPFGSVFVSLRNGGPGFAGRLRAFLEERVTKTEVLGYLTADD